MIYQDYVEGAAILREKIGQNNPKALIIEGSGFSFLSDSVEDPVVIPYSSIPNMSVATAPGHKGSFVSGKINGTDVLIMQGRFHLYEGHSYENVAFPIRIARLLGADTLLSTNAVGAINKTFNVGDIVMITDSMQFCLSPLTGPNIDEFGPRFPDMTHSFCRMHIATLTETAKELEIDLKKGTYVYTSGPQYETPAEIKAYGILGADVVGMSCVPESIIANHCGMRVAAISLVSNMAAGMNDSPLSGSDVLESVSRSQIPLSKLLIKFIGKL